MSAATLDVQVTAKAEVARGVVSLELQAPDRGALPAFDPGAHVDLHLTNGMVRSYSLVNLPGDGGRYLIAVNRDRASRGGSAFIHDNVRQGDLLTISPPRNNFPLAEEAPHSVFIAGGIGITPIWCMIQRLRAAGRSWELHYSVRSRASAAFLGELEGLLRREAARIFLNFDDESGGKQLDIGNLVKASASGAHLYCCGPVPMLESFQRASVNRPTSEVHVEYFHAKAPPAVIGDFTIVLARSGANLLVRSGGTILDALLANGYDVPHSCRDGICGTCETKVLEGIPDHRDLVLSEDAREANRTMMICCSGSKTARLVLDL